MHQHSWRLVGSVVASPGPRRLCVAGDGSGMRCYVCCGCVVSQWVAAHARQQGCPVMDKSLYCAGTSSLPPLASPGCSRIDVNSSIDDELFSESFLNGILWWADPGWMPSAHQSCSITPLLSWTGERKYNKRLVGRGKDRERSLSNYHHGQNRLNLGKKLIYFITSQISVG